jgi:hypothetical protein
MLPGYQKEKHQEVKQNSFKKPIGSSVLYHMQIKKKKA